MILPEKIQLLKRIDKEGRAFSLETLLQQRYEDLIWQPISFLEEKENPILRKSL